MPAGPRRTATAGMRLEATKHARGSCATNTTRRTARLIRPRCRHLPGDLHQKKNSRCQRPTMSTSASGTSPVGRGTSGAAAASSGGLSPLSIYGFPFVASVCSVCSPDALRAHTHTHLHTQTHARTTTDWRLRGNVPVTAGGESLVYEKLVAVLVFSVSSNFRGCGCSQARSEQRERFSTKFPWRPVNKRC